MKKIVDSGKKIGGSVKDVRRREHLDQELIDEISHITDYNNIKRNILFPTPNYANLYHHGASLETIGFIKMIRDQIAITPRLISTVSNGYVAEIYDKYTQILEFLNEKIPFARNVNDISSICSDVWNILEIKRPLKKMEDLDALQRALFIAVSAKDMFPFTVMADDMVKAQKTGADLLERERLKHNPIIEVGITTLTYKDGTVLYAVNKNINKRKLFFGNDLIGVPSYHQLKRSKLFKTKEDANHAISDVLTSNKKEVKVGRRSITNRVGPQIREYSVTPDQLKSEFGLKSVEFGEALSDRERQEIINHAYDALFDLSEILGIPKNKIGMNNTLSIAFGSRGKASSMAHYESDNHVINLTRIRGAGSLAHEYGHALDHYYFIKNKGEDLVIDKEKGTRAFCSDSYDLLDGNVYNNFLNIMKIIKEKKVPASIWNKSVLKINKNLSQELILRAKLDSDYYLPIPEGKEKYFESNMYQISDFMSEAMQSSKGRYYTSDRELFARAFECYVYDSLVKKEQKNDYLVNSVEDSYYLEAGLSFNPYPTDKERADIFKGMSILLEEYSQNILKNNIKKTRTSVFELS